MNHDEFPARAISARGWWIAGGIVVAAIALCFWWLLSDREPTQQEMTAAYRTYVVAISADRTPEALFRIRRHLKDIELVKRQCSRLETARYRCTAAVTTNDRPAASRHGAEDGIYLHDIMGWKFERFDGGARVP